MVRFLKRHVFAVVLGAGASISILIAIFLWTEISQGQLQREAELRRRIADATRIASSLTRLAAEKQALEEGQGEQHSKIRLAASEGLAQSAFQSSIEQKLRISGARLLSITPERVDAGRLRAVFEAEAPYRAALKSIEKIEADNTGARIDSLRLDPIETERNMAPSVSPSLRFTLGVSEPFRLQSAEPTNGTDGVRQ